MSDFRIIKVKEGEIESLSRVQLYATQWTVAYQASPSMEFSISFSRGSS